MINKTRKSWKVSRVLKLPIFEKKFISRFFGLQMAGLATALSVVAYPTHAFDYNLAQASQNVEEAVVVTTTNSQYRFPLETTLGMSQGFHGLHGGVDLRAPRGTNVYAMDGGVVIEVEKVFVGYGHFVRIAHNGTVSSLYAHLDKVEVKAGEKVSAGKTIGTVGMTGWSTGPHLHFEVYVGNKTVNPMNYIGKIQGSNKKN